MTDIFLNTVLNPTFMISKETAALVSLANKGIILNPKSKKEEIVLFSDVSKIHLRILKTKTIVTIFLVVYFIFTLMYTRYLTFELSLFSILIFLINFMLVRTIDFKSYSLRIILKNNAVIEQRFPKKLKFEIVELIHEVRSHTLYNFKPLSK